MYIKQYSLKRAGSNYLASLIKANFEDTFILVNVLGWKHKNNNFYPSFKKLNWYHDYYPKHDEISKDRLEDIRAKIDTKYFGYLFSIKNPYDWIVSIAKYRNAPLRKFNGIIIKDLILRWNRKLKNYNKFCINNNCLIVKYEDLLENLENELDTIKNKMDLLKKETDYTDIPFRVGAGNDTAKFIKDKKPLNLKKIQNYHSKLSQDHIDTINRYIDFDILHKFDYKEL